MLEQNASQSRKEDDANDACALIHSESTRDSVVLRTRLVFVGIESVAEDAFHARTLAKENIWVRESEKRDRN